MDKRVYSGGSAMMIIVECSERVRRNYEELRKEKGRVEGEWM